MKTALSIAGSDSCGGAGIQADIKTMTMNGVYAMTAITALTAQNTTGVRAIQEATPAFLKEQLDAVFEDIFPDAVKIGMVSSSDLIRVIAERLRHYGAKNIVVDPVMVATSGSSLMKTDAVQTLIDELLPLSTVITPNIPEGEILSSEKIESIFRLPVSSVFAVFSVIMSVQKRLFNFRAVAYIQTYIRHLGAAFGDKRVFDGFCSAFSPRK